MITKRDVLLYILMLFINKNKLISYSKTFPGKMTGVKPSVNMLGLILYSGTHVVFLLSQTFAATIN